MLQGKEKRVGSLVNTEPNPQNLKDLLV